MRCLCCQLFVESCVFSGNPRPIGLWLFGMYFHVGLAMPKSLIPRCLLAGMFFTTLMVAVVASPPKVTPVKLGHAGIRPQAVMDDTGIVHIVQASAEVRGELNYVRHVPGEGGFSEPIEVLQAAEDMAASFNMVR